MSLAIFGGVRGDTHGQTVDRIITGRRPSATAVPEFVWPSLLIVIFGIWLGSSRSPPRRRRIADPSTQVEHCSCPRSARLVLFGYIARMARAGTIEALDADYTRTAVLKGLPQRR